MAWCTGARRRKSDGGGRRDSLMRDGVYDGQKEGEKEDSEDGRASS